MEDALIDNIFVLFGRLVFQQTTCISMGTICAPLVAEMFLHAYVACILQGAVTNIKLEN